MKEIILIRHGEASHLTGESPMTGGWTDNPLTDKGKAQAKKVGNQLISDHVDFSEFEMYSSSLLRAKTTAEIIAYRIGITYIITDEIKELNNGIAKDMKEDEAKEIRNSHILPFQEYRKYEGSENYRELYNRITIFMNGLQDEKVIIITHKDTASAIVHWWLRHSVEQIGQTSFLLQPCSITNLDLNAVGQRRVRQLNYIQHL